MTLEAVLAGAVSANQPEFHIDYLVRDNTGVFTPKPGLLRGELNSTTDVTLISPSTGRYASQAFVAEILSLTIYNKDTATVTVTIKTTDGTTDRIQAKIVLLTGESVCWNSASGDWSLVS